MPSLGLGSKCDIELKYADAHQKQENQVDSVRGFIAQGVDAIRLAPVVAMGWTDVMTEAKDAGIPVVLLNRGVSASQDLYLASVASDQIKEGRAAKLWIADRLQERLAVLLR